MTFSRVTFCCAVLSLLAACDKESTEGSPPAASEQSATLAATQDSAATPPEESVVAVAGRPERDPEAPEIKALPEGMGFDPCSLITDSFAQSIGVPTDQRIERLGATRKIPSHHRITLYVGCRWRSVKHAVPMLTIEVQQADSEMSMPDPANVALADGAWFAERRGREELRVHAGDYVLFIQADLLDRMDSQAQHVRIAEAVLDNLRARPMGPTMKQEASVFGGPERTLCDVAKESGLADILPGPTVWAFPISAQNKEPDLENARPDPDFVGCAFAGVQRGSARVLFYGPHGIKNRIAHYEKQTPVTVSGINGYQSRDGVYLPFAGGALEIEERMAPFDDAMLAEKLANIAAEIVAAMK